jgi:hypothetical protein
MAAGALQDKVTEPEVCDTGNTLVGTAGAVDIVKTGVKNPDPTALTAATANLYALPPTSPDTTAVAVLTEKLYRN